MTRCYINPCLPYLPYLIQVYETTRLIIITVVLMVTPVDLCYISLLCFWLWLDGGLCVCVCVCLAVMASDYASCLHMLMKYPPIADMQYFIDMARYLREPNVCCRRSTYSY